MLVLALAGEDFVTDDNRSEAHIAPCTGAAVLPPYRLLTRGSWSPRL
jgi:hypothetical protein